MEDQLSLYFLIAQLVAVPPSLGLGIVADKVKNWKLLLIMHILMITSMILWYISVPNEDHIYTADEPAPILMPIGFILSNIFASANYTTNLTILAKAVAETTTVRGILFGAGCFANSLGVLLMDGLGGYTYDIDKSDPFIIVLTSESFCIVLTIGLALMGQLHI